MKIAFLLLADILKTMKVLKRENHVMRAYQPETPKQTKRKKTWVYATLACYCAACAFNCSTHLPKEKNCQSVKVSTPNCQATLFNFSVIVQLSFLSFIAIMISVNNCLKNNNGLSKAL